MSALDLVTEMNQWEAFVILGFLVAALAVCAVVGGSALTDAPHQIHDQELAEHEIAFIARSRTAPPAVHDGRYTYADHLRDTGALR